MSTSEFTPPSPPAIRVGRVVFETVAPAALPEVIDALREHIFSQRHLSIEARQSWFARATAAAAVNALLEEHAARGP